jgi:hypothetical protein
MHLLLQSSAVIQRFDEVAIEHVSSWHQKIFPVDLNPEAWIDLAFLHRIIRMRRQIRGRIVDGIEEPHG